jgi:coenzyme F420-dependent glucose-6-phosphate dehydrogenase
MIELGYALSSEEHGPLDLVTNARAAEEAGFTFALISDHFHPWIDRQGESPFVWSVIGAIARETERLQLGTGVTCPMIRIHPAIIAQAAATSAAMMSGRFFLGVGSGENLNEHVLGDRWPAPDERLEMLEESIEVIRKLWEGGKQTFRGKHYTVEGARIYTLPDEPPPIAVAAAAPKAAELAGRVGDAFVGVAPESELVDKFEQSGGAGKPRYGQVIVCWAESEEEARKTAHEWWPNAGLEGDLTQELPLPEHFEQATAGVEEDDVAETVVCGPDPERHLEQIRTFAEAGYDHVYVHQVGPDQKGFLDFYEREILPQLGTVREAARSAR